MAELVSTWSKDPSTKVGAVVVGSKRQILATGYNGFPRGIDDTDERLTNRDLKYNYVVHAEMNAIYNASYTGTLLDGSSIYVHGLPVCNECCKGIIQVGINRVFVSEGCLSKKPHWYESWEKSERMFAEAGVEIEFV